MNILVAPNSMKGSLNAFDFADTVEKALLEFSSKMKVRKVPVADGGDFTGEILAKALKAEPVIVRVRNPLGKTIYSDYFISGKIAIVEMANASGMKLLEKGELNPLKTSTFGTGELIADAIGKGCEQIFLAIGGSATVDGGMGILEALGFRFYDKNQNELTGNGNSLIRVAGISVPASMPQVSIKIICDVDNPLLGKTGAAAVFAPQKGATPEMVTQLEAGLKNWSDVINIKTGTGCTNLKGTGAAGGIAVPLLSFFDAEIVQGADFVLSILNFDEHVKWADVVITGEGKLDAQTLNNKAPFAVAQWAKKQNKPVFAIGGQVENEAAIAFDGIFSITGKSISPDYAMKNAQKLLYNFAVEFAEKHNELVRKSRNE